MVDKLNPFPNPAGPVADWAVRGNDNLLANAHNSVVDALSAITSAQGATLMNGGAAQERVADTTLRSTMADILDVLGEIEALLQAAADHQGVH